MGADGIPVGSPGPGMATLNTYSTPERALVADYLL